MANTYSQMYAHCVWSVKRREPLISSSHREELQKHITGIITKRGQKLIAIYCMPDHIHLLIGFKPNVSISDIVHDVKRASTVFIKEQNWLKTAFSWQDGFGCFTCSHADLPRVCDYIHKQEEHHAKRTFEDEYRLFLTKYGISYEDVYLFG
jgi:putative transposase